MFDRNLLGIAGMKGVLGALMVLALVQAAAIIGQAHTLSQAIAGLWAGMPAVQAAPELAAFLACFVVRRLVLFSQETMLDRFATAKARDLKRGFLESIFGDGAAAKRAHGTASLAATATQGIDDVEEYLRIIPPKLIGIAAITIPVAVATFALDWPSGIILVVMFPVIMFFMLLLGKQAKSRAERQYSAFHRLSNHFLDTLRGIDAIVAAGATERTEREVFDSSEKLRAATVRTLTTATLSSAVLDLCATFGVAAVAMMLAFRLMDGSLSLSVALAALMLAPEFFAPIRAFAGDFHASLDGKNALASVLAVVDERGGAVAGQADGEVIERASADQDVSSAGCVRFDGVRYRYAGSPADAVFDLTFSIAPGEHVAILGKSGSGKSTVAALAAGLAVPSGGCVEAPNARLIPQRPHIFSDTLARNIAFYRPEASADEVASVAGAVGLGALVESLPHGLETLVGEGHRGLSGGEAHRVALARVLLDDRADILVFDEPTAHLDLETELDLKQGILALLEGRTVIFATHRLHWVEHMDRVIVLDGGCIARDEPVVSPESTNALALDFTEDFCEGVRDQAITTKARHGFSEAHACSKGAGDEERPVESAARPSRGKWLWSFLASYKRPVAVAIALGLVASGFSALLMLTGGYLVSATALPDVTLFSIMIPVAFVQVFGLGRPLARYVERLVSHSWVLRVTSDLRRMLFRHVSRTAMDPVHARATGDYLSVLSDDIGHVQNLYLRCAFQLIVSALLSLCAAACFGTFSLAAGAIALCLCITVAGVVPLAAFVLTRMQTIAAKRGRAREYASLTDDLIGIDDWMLAGRAAEAVHAHDEADGRVRHEGGRSRLVVRILEFTSVALLGVAACGVAWWSGEAFGGQGWVSNWIAAFTLGFFPLIDSFAALPEAAAGIHEHMESVDGLMRADKRSSLHEREKVSALGYAVEIRLEDVSYSYPEQDAREAADGDGAQEASHREDALSHLSIAICPGERVAVLGRSGAGKSTFVALVRGLMSPDHGTVFVDGRAVRAGASDLSQAVGFLSQRPYIFDKTLRENLSLAAPGATDERLMELAEGVGLADRIAVLPNGLDTQVGEMGTGFSGGEAHRIALARVLAADVGAVVVDEPFAALDPETERGLLDTIFASCEGKTLVVVTHHLAQVERFDRVVFFEEGRVVMDGSPAGLMESNPRFRALVAQDVDFACPRVSQAAGPAKGDSGLASAKPR